ncbi:MAG: hypothetical protein ACI3ZN_05045 [Candidatus Cryptobacteroides sp.]
MTELKLHELYAFVCGHSMDGLSAKEQDSLARILISFDSLSICALTGEWFSRERLQSVVDALFRAVSSDNFASLIVKYRLSKELSFAHYGKKDEECSRIYETLMTGKKNNISPEDEVDMIQCIIYEWGNVEGDLDEVEDVLLLKRICSKWMDAINPKTQMWDIHCSDIVAVRRLQILQYYTYRCNNSAFPLADISNAYWAKFKEQTESSVDIALASAWYDYFRFYNYQEASDAVLKEISSLLSSCLDLYLPSAETTDTNFYPALASVTEQTVAELIETTQREMFE